MGESAKLLWLLPALLIVILLMASSVEAQDDADSDGVDDEHDQCPDTPEGVTVDSDGCSDTQNNSNNSGNSSGGNNTSRDDDGDGVYDGNDTCPTTVSGNQVNEEGCSGNQLDDDQDGVSNSHDQCSSTPFSESRVVNGEGCTPFMEETLADDVPIVGRVSNGNAIGAGTLSMILGGIGWAWRAGRVIGLTGGSGKRRKKRFLRRINKASSTVELEGIKKELNKANEKSKLPDGAYADLITAQEQRGIILRSAPTGGKEDGKKLGLRPSSKPPQE